MKNKLWVVDSDFPQVAYEVTEQELVDMIEKNNKPEWWQDFYKQELIERWNAKN